MVIAVIAMWMMQVAVHQIVDVIAMRNRFVSATRAVHVIWRVAAAVMGGRASVRVFCAYLKSVLVDMIAMRMVQMAIMQVVDVVAMPDGRVPAARAVLVVVMGMMGFIAGAHVDAPQLISHRDKYILRH
jgi:hypothetical protein